ncbi:hypothetical protein BDZ94DRAFT_640164 [Collybia nuda]|uniref:Uncharacterized protein n=1 Tax=Collybia nuda TaxID=64659 RepID=A0A9P6CIB7_9AGAR|nr:hypothetical protein BDZ94DRAFT_640164 [Collybia nuda]
MIFLPSAILLLIINFEWGLRKVYAGNTVCTSNHSDWYTSVIGETPCTTYERLRQICNSAYQVGTLTRNTPPDHCDDQVQDCCCNSISFALSMLCLACQDNTADGFDAGVGAYQQYLLKDGNNTCGPRKDRNFTTTIQNAVCNSDIKIEDQLYNLFWVDGQWCVTRTPTPDFD